MMGILILHQYVKLIEYSSVSLGGKGGGESGMIKRDMLQEKTTRA